MNNMFVYVKIPEVPLRVSYRVRTLLTNRLRWANFAFFCLCPSVRNYDSSSSLDRVTTII